MDFEQIVKRLDWLDDENRKLKTTLEETREGLAGMEAENKTLRKKLKELTTQLTGLTATSGRMDEYDTALERHRKEITAFVGSLEKRHDANQVEIDKRYRMEFDALNKSISEIKKVKDSVAEVKREIKGLAEEEVRWKKANAEAVAKMESMLKIAEQAQRSMHAADESRRKDTKHLADLQGELTALRKRVDETREKVDVNTASVRRTEVRMTELAASETERRQAATVFIETQSRMQVERERALKESQEKFEGLAHQSEKLETQLQNWESAQRAVKRAQEAYEEITTKFERRINEITEIQRLGEDRFRQEWVSFKADDQKRWTSFTLTQDENRKDNTADIEKMNHRIIAIEDLTETLQDLIQQTRDADEQMLQAVLAHIHELLSAYERIKGTA